MSLKVKVLVDFEFRTEKVSNDMIDVHDVNTDVLEIESVDK